MRVIVASERPAVRYFLKDAVEEEEGTEVVGQAENTINTLLLARDTRPDVAVIDSNLPYNIGEVTNPLSRMSGLDSAQAISERIPETRVVVITNLDSPGLLEYQPNSNVVPSFSRLRVKADIPFKLEDLYRETPPTNDLVFAKVEMEPAPTLVSAGVGKADKAIVLGWGGILGGGYMIITIILAPIGLPLALAGAMTAGIGLTAKMFNRRNRR